MSNSVNSHWLNLIEDSIEMRIPFEVQPTSETIGFSLKNCLSKIDLI
jgi:hypothetical protein